MTSPPRPHALARAALVDTFNRGLELIWRKGWSPPPVLDPAQLWRKAAQGLSDTAEHGGRNVADVEDFRLRLDRLCESIEAEAQLNALGLTIAHGQLARAIRQRLHLGRLWLREPKLPQTPIAPPILVVGQMRAGTTRIHRLLATDPAHCATRFCDSWHPVPRTIDLRPFWSGLALYGARKLNPWLDTIHPFGMRQPDEELGWLATALDHCAYEAQWRIPTFTAFSEARDASPVYREFARILATDAAYHRNADLPRVMKVPQFSEDLDTLLKQFPDARVVLAQREPLSVLGSAKSLVANQMAIQSDNVDLDWIENEWRRKSDLREMRMRAALEHFSGPVAYVDFTAVEQDWETAMATIYRELGIGFTPAARRAMARQVDHSARSAHRRHVYEPLGPKVQPTIS